jgi:N-acetylglucosaminyldiphosphoundecaprenol N-acetyl-beta-D-mannosaminyltransferase
MKIERFNIGKLEISKVNLSKTLSCIEKALSGSYPGLICVTNTRTAYIANKDPGYCSIQNNSLITVPDGVPLVWIAHNKGFDEVGKVSGIDLMYALFAVSNEKNYSHFFYGSTPYVIEKLQVDLKRKFPGLAIAGAVSPAFQPLEHFDPDEIAREINRLKPTFFWCGLGAPKQERLIALLQPKLKNTICIGIGLAFEYGSGTVKRAPVWMCESGLEWLYRLVQQPQKIKREVLPFSWMIGHLVLSYIKKR